MNAFEKIVQQDIRLVILQLLNQDADYKHNEHVLKAALKAVGHNISGDRLRTELAWLAEQHLVETAPVSGMMIVRLTARGADVAEGAVLVPGVKRPDPEL